MARAIKAGLDVGRGSALPAASATEYDVFVIENTADPAGEPDGAWYRTNGNWVLIDGLTTSGVGTASALPSAASTPNRVFVIENSADPAGEPDGLWFAIDNNWVLAVAA